MKPWHSERILIGKSVVKAVLDAVMDAWTDVKSIKFSLYAQQFGSSVPIPYKAIG